MTKISLFGVTLLIISERKKHINIIDFKNFMSGFKFLQSIRSRVIVIAELIKPRFPKKNRPTLLAHSRSQAGQESFAFAINKGVEKPTYLEIGAGHPVENSNTYLLESQEKWAGYSWDLDASLEKLWTKKRYNPIFYSDASKTDWKEFFKNHGYQYEYLSLDINSASLAIDILSNLFECGGKFSCMTIEHDIYVARTNKEIVENLRTLLSQNNYILVSKNIKHRWRCFEDWWVHSTVNIEDYMPFKSDCKEGKALFTKKSQFRSFLALKREYF